MDKKSAIIISHIKSKHLLNTNFWLKGGMYAITRMPNKARVLHHNSPGDIAEVERC